ncbi:MAG TPA: ABC transporter ATP-binding protein [Candidatus Atribacteria bacterium]|nr:ABC transporter ATP-binding protein [Candidatus Atribacteria bacterium]
MADKIILEAVNLKKYYHRGSEIVKALDGVELKIKESEIVSIVGCSGSGKTTLMNLISCLDKMTAGSLKIGNTDVTSLEENDLIRIRRENIGFVFQRFYLIPTLTVRENVELPLIFAKKNIDEKNILDLLKEVNLEDKKEIQVKYLSGGDKQRTGIARALVNNPKMLIADEPMGKLETKVGFQILELFKRLSQKGLAVFIATHDLELAQAAQKIIHLQDGKIIPKEKSDLYY